MRPRLLGHHPRGFVSRELNETHHIGITRVRPEPCRVNPEPAAAIRRRRETITSSPAIRPPRSRARCPNTIGGIALQEQRGERQRYDYDTNVPGPRFVPEIAIKFRAQPPTPHRLPPSSSPTRRDSTQTTTPSPAVPVTTARGNKHAPHTHDSAGATETFTVMSPSQPRSRPHERKRTPGVALAREVAIG